MIPLLLISFVFSRILLHNNWANKHIIEFTTSLLTQQLTVNYYTICRLFLLCSGVKVIINTTSCHSSLCINPCNCCAHNLQLVSITYQSTIPSFNKHHYIINTTHWIYHPIIKQNHEYFTYS